MIKKLNFFRGVAEESNYNLELIIDYEIIYYGRDDKFILGNGIEVRNWKKITFS